MCSYSSQSPSKAQRDRAPSSPPPLSHDRKKKERKKETETYNPVPHIEQTFHLTPSKRSPEARGQEGLTRKEDELSLHIELCQRYACPVTGHLREPVQVAGIGCGVHEVHELLQRALGRRLGCIPAACRHRSPGRRQHLVQADVPEELPILEGGGRRGSRSGANVLRRREARRKERQRQRQRRGREGEGSEEGAAEPYEEAMPGTEEGKGHVSGCPVQDLPQAALLLCLC